MIKFWFFFSYPLMWKLDTFWVVPWFFNLFVPSYHCSSLSSSSSFSSTTLSLLHLLLLLLRCLLLLLLLLLVYCDDSYVTFWKPDFDAPLMTDFISLLRVFMFLVLWCCCLVSLVVYGKIWSSCLALWWWSSGAAWLFLAETHHHHCCICSLSLFLSIYIHAYTHTL